MRSGSFTRLKSVLFWSIISAAFIGPGTVTTASKAGASFGVTLIWALVFSILATVVLQEAAARLTISTGHNLGKAIARRFADNHLVKWMIFLAVAFGCAAYQAGNILGAVSGVQLATQFDPRLITTVIFVIAVVFLWKGNFQSIARLLGIVVAIMGISFIIVASQAPVSAPEILKHALVPELPDGSLLLVVALIGTTIVPYNLFLGSGISHGQKVGEMRVGLTIAVLIGGIISVAILLSGTLISGTFSFDSLSTALEESTGPWAKHLFAAGLFAAGMTSSITAPLAAAVTARSVFSDADNPWETNSMQFRTVWVTVLGVGYVFSMFHFQPVPVIIAAQAINGMLLPIIAIFLFFAINDRTIVQAENRNPHWLNILTALIVMIAAFLGVNNLFKALDRSLSLEMDSAHLLVMAGAIAVSIGVWLFLSAFRRIQYES